jgi:hypothetical protein
VDPSILAASGRGIDFQLAAPSRLDSLRFVASRPDSEFSKERYRWIMDHQVEVESWLRVQQAAGRPVSVNDHPGLRAMTFDRIGVSGKVESGLYAISANLVAGLPFRIRDQLGNIWNADEDAYGRFRTLEPIAQIGYSIFVYDVHSTH